MTQSLRCRLGLHAYVASRPASIFDGFPPPVDIGYRERTRTCTRCARTQKWLPGYGGSEWGCWMDLPVGSKA